MKLIQNQPADTWMQAFYLGSGKMQGRIYGRTDKERIDLSEQTFLELRDGRTSRGKAIAGHLEITPENGGESSEYQRILDLHTGMITSSWKSCNGVVGVRAFAPKSHKIMVYEISCENNDLNLHIAYLPERKEDYINYNNGGIFFTSDLKDQILCGKAALSTNGFPKADESGITVKNASRVTLLIMLDTAAVEKEEQRNQVMLNLQMQMNRSLVNLESRTIDELAKEPKGNMQKYRRMERRQMRKKLE